MTPAQFDTYRTERYEKQQAWYSKKARQNKARYQALQWSNIILAVLTPVLIASLPEGSRWISLIPSVLLGIGTAGLKTFNYQENWFNYRNISETLKKEIFLYTARIDAYADAEDPEALFVERVESVISRESSLWIQAQRLKHKKQEDHAPDVRAAIQPDV